MLISIIWWIAGVLSIGYFAGYVAIVGINNSFTFFWLAFGIFAIGVGLLHKILQTKSNIWITRAEHAFYVVFACVLLIFLVVLGLIMKESHESPDKNADYMIILGAHVYGERMSANLKYRVETAYEYLQENKETKVILSGGQGSGEKITEAEAMRRYLVEKGVVSERIIVEDTSRNTEENIQNSMKKMDAKANRVIIVSNDFHVYRAVGIAKKLGIANAQGLGSKTHLYTAINCYTREVIAVLKYKLCGQI